jgi:hypothetical protein
MRHRRLRWTAIAVATIALLAYLRDPPWAGRVTSGLGPWEKDAQGAAFRWTFGRASFFIPSEGTAMTVPLRAASPGPGGGPVTVEIRVDDRWLGTIELRDPDEWVRPQLPLGQRPARRRFRRVDLRVNRVVPPYMLGVMTGDVVVQQ